MNKRACCYNVSWESIPEYKEWLGSDPKDSAAERCKVSRKTFSIANMGEAALKSHMKSSKDKSKPTKHEKNIKAVSGKGKKRCLCHLSLHPVCQRQLLQLHRLLHGFQNPLGFCKSGQVMYLKQRFCGCLKMLAVITVIIQVTRLTSYFRQCFLIAVLPQTCNVVRPKQHILQPMGLLHFLRISWSAK